jgi:hypothetical protein
MHDEAAARPRPAATAGVGARLSAASNKVQADTGSPAYWAKRIIVFPIGERWALISVLAAFVNGRVALTAVVAWQVLALASAVLVLIFLLGEPTKAGLIAGTVIVLGAGLASRARHAAPLDWLVPATLRVAEYLLVVAAGLLGPVPPAVVFLLLFVLALRHYDLTARLEKAAPGGSARQAWLGWDGRILILTASAVSGYATLGVAVLAGVVAVELVAGVVADRRSEK